MFADCSSGSGRAKRLECAEFRRFGCCPITSKVKAREYGALQTLRAISIAALPRWALRVSAVCSGLRFGCGSRFSPDTLPMILP
jgi:hypothetical protein